MTTRFESLHNHTKASDGPYSYLELMEAAEQNHYGIMALTDHDVLPSEQDISALHAYTGPIKWLSGIEISSGLPHEVGGGVASMFHILGLFVDPTNQALIDHSDTAIHARNERMERIVKGLRSIGFDITAEDCLADSGGEVVGRRNIANALARSPRCEQIMDRLKRQMADEAKEDPEVALQYMRLLEHDQKEQMFQLFLTEDAYLPGVYVDYLYNIDMDKAVKLIREAGGIAVVAHYPTISGKIGPQLLEQILADKRLDGVELRTGFVDGTSERSEADLRAMAERTGAVVTYGVDGHTPRDLENFTKDYPLALRTVGQTQALIDRFKPDLQWSNLG